MKHLLLVCLLCIAACTPAQESTGEAAQAVVTVEDGADTLENMAVGFHRVDSSWLILSANAAELAAMRCTAAQYVGQPIADFHASQATITSMATTLAAGGEIHGYPAELVRCDGTHIYTMIWSSTYRSDPNAPTVEFDHTRCLTGEVSRREWLLAKVRLGLL